MDTLECGRARPEGFGAGDLEARTIVQLKKPSNSNRKQAKEAYEEHRHVPEGPRLATWGFKLITECLQGETQL